MTNESSPKTTISRLTFLNASATTLGGVSAGLFTPSLAHAQSGRLADVDAPAVRFQGPVDESWLSVRKHFNIVDDMAFMQNGTLGPMPRSVLAMNVRSLQQIAEDPRDPIGRQVEDSRRKIAAFVGADPDEIVLTRSTTEGLKIFCQGLDLKQGDEVVMGSLDHPNLPGDRQESGPGAERGTCVDALLQRPDEVDRLLRAVTHVAANPSKYMSVASAANRAHDDLSSFV